MQHIGRKELYTSLEARVQYLHSFLDFSTGMKQIPVASAIPKLVIANKTCTEDINALIVGSKYIKALIPAVVNIVYKKLLQYDVTARAFTTRSTSYEGPVDEVPDENSPQIRYRKMFLRGYLQALCSDPNKMEYWAYLDKVG